MARISQRIGLWEALEKRLKSIDVRQNACSDAGL